jgi:hypothetical protein
MKNIAAILLVALGVFLTGCKADLDFKGTESGTNLGNDLPQPDPNSTICNPFDNDHQNGSSIYGLAGGLFYLTDDQPRYESVTDYVTSGHQLDDYVIYMSRLFVPTRPFDRGFVTQTGDTLKTPTGDTLYEWFALRLNSRIRLHTGDAEGNYQFAVLSDDGSIFTLGSPGATLDVINNDGVTPTRMACSATAIPMTKNSKIPMRIDYFQGPRFHISMVLLWRPYPTNPNDVIDPLCGHASNEDYFDSTQNPPVEGPAYAALLSRGWKPLRMENFLIQDGVNPCNEDK